MLPITKCITTWRSTKIKKRLPSRCHHYVHENPLHWSTLLSVATSITRDDSDTDDSPSTLHMALPAVFQPLLELVLTLAFRVKCSLVPRLKWWRSRRTWGSSFGGGARINAVGVTQYCLHNYLKKKLTGWSENRNFARATSSCHQPIAGTYSQRLKVLSSSTTWAGWCDGWSNLPYMNRPRNDKEPTLFFSKEEREPVCAMPKKCQSPPRINPRTCGLHDQCSTAWAIENKRDSTRKTDATHALATTATD